MTLAHTARDRRGGLSVIELIVVLAVVGVLAGVGIVAVQPPSSRLLANDLASQLRQGRFEALKRNQPVAVLFDQARGVVETRFAPGSQAVSAACSGGSVLASRAVSDYRGVTIRDGEGPEVVWLPNGQGRACDGGPIAITSIVVDGARSTHVVAVSTGGGVSVR